MNQELTDKERLDWMDKNRRGVMWNTQIEYWAVQSQKQVAGDPKNTPIRNAIDAVIKSEPVTDS